MYIFFKVITTNVCIKHMLFYGINSLFWWAQLLLVPNSPNCFKFNSLLYTLAHSFCHYLCAWPINHSITDWHLSTYIYHFSIFLQHLASLIYQVSFYSTPTATLSMTEQGLVLLFFIFYIFHIRHNKWGYSATARQH